MGFAVAAAVAAEEGGMRVRLRDLGRDPSVASVPPAIPLRANEVSVRGLIIMIHADTNPAAARGV